MNNPSQGKQLNNGTNENSRRAQPDDLHVQEVIRSAEHELHELLEQRADLMKRIGTIKQTWPGWRISLVTRCSRTNC